MTQRATPDDPLKPLGAILGERPEQPPLQSRLCRQCDARFTTRWATRLICDRCIEGYEQKIVGEELRLALETIPHTKRWARFDAVEFASRVGNAAARTKAEQAKSRVILLVGPSGAGKTSLACAIFRRLLAGAESIRASRFMFSAALGRIPSESPYGTEAHAIRQARRAPLLVLDDLGSEVDRTMLLEATKTVADVFLEREREGRTTIVTTFLEEPALVARYGDGVVRRLGSGDLIELGGRKWGAGA